MNYYNENDPFAAAWLRQLIAGNHIPAGFVDERSIIDVCPEDLTEFIQCHFFAGIGGWSRALYLAGWPDDRHIWTGSCPCQPFSVAGNQRGTKDARHLWPHFFRFIAAVRPPVVMGEQVAGKAGYGWFDGVSSDLGKEGYASRAVDIPALAANAPHIRQRLYWCAVEGMDDSTSARRSASGREPMGPARNDARRAGFERRSGDGCSVADSDSELHDGSRDIGAGWRAEHPNGCVSSFWDGAEWRSGADGKARRTKPGVRLLVDGVPNRVGRLRGYGNAIVPPLAAEVIKAFLDVA